MTISERIQQIQIYLTSHLTRGEETFKRGVIWIGESGSQAMHDIYSLDGFEKWTKALLANLKFVSLIPSIRGLFDSVIVTLDAQKDLYQATKFLKSIGDLWWGADGRLANGVRDEDKKTGRKIGINLPLLFYAIGNFFETGKFLQKYKLMSFPTLTRLSNEYGSYKVFNQRLDDIPVLGSVFDKPKELLVFMASAIESYTGYDKAKESKSWEDWLKVTSSTGRMVLITFGKWCFNATWFMFADVVTQNANLVATLIKCHRLREERFLSIK